MLPLDVAIVYLGTSACFTLGYVIAAYITHKHNAKRTEQHQ